MLLVVILCTEDERERENERFVDVCHVMVSVNEVHIKCVRDAKYGRKC